MHDMIEYWFYWCILIVKFFYCLILYHYENNQFRQFNSLLFVAIIRVYDENKINSKKRIKYTLFYSIVRFSSSMFYHYTIKRERERNACSNNNNNSTIYPHCKWLLITYSNIHTPKFKCKWLIEEIYKTENTYLI
jgi:hypothetical protein